MLSNERPQPREAELLTLRVVGLYQTVAVEQCCLALLEHYLLLLVVDPQHKAQGHPPGPEFFGIATMPQVGQVVARVGVSQAIALRACANRRVASVARSSKKAIEALLPLSSTKSCQPIGAASKCVEGEFPEVGMQDDAYPCSLATR